MSDKDPVIEIRNLWFSYNGNPVFKDISVSVDKNDFACVIGPNGGGKSTFIKLILGLLKPNRGTVRVLGKPPGEMLEKIGYMPQNVEHDNLFPVSVKDVVLMGRLHHRHFLGRYDSEDKETALNALDEVDMKDFADRPFAELSGGQRQRVLIARGLSSEPQLLLLDEPTSNVDIAVEKEFFELLKQLNERMTIVVVSHDLGFVSKYVKNIICINREIHIHKPADLDGKEINRIYGMEMQLVVHDHDYGEKK